MRVQEVNPISGIYLPLQAAAEHFNKALYEGALPTHVFTLQRAKRTAGFFSPQRWRHLDGTLMSEIALNPRVLSNRPLWKLFQTIVREQCHLWQHTFGTPGRPGYHNSEWAQKMEEIGLIPTSTGHPGGARTGQKLATYPVAEGAFAGACVAIVHSGFNFPWIDQGIDPVATCDTLSLAGVKPDVLARLNTPLNAQSLGIPETSEEDGAPKRKINYRCPQCSTNVWGKPGIKLLCACCNKEYEAIN